jgi:hypothetical protein
MRTMQVMLAFGAAVAEMVGSVVARGSPASLQEGPASWVVESSSNDTMDARTLALSSNVSL